ncbi:MAG: hypothetical protein JXO22_16985 [Phycisphaerae bacterium]|nr:hypothetical protein [Phycisphaerae bacterium]
METASSTPVAPSPAVVWVRRLRMILAILLVWALLQFLVTGLVMPRGLDRATVMAGAASPVLALPALLIVLWLGAALGTLLSGRTKPADAILVTSFGLALWAAFGGTMSTWLTEHNVTQGPPTGAPYWPLLLDYIVLLLGMTGVAISGVLVARRGPLTKELRLHRIMPELPMGCAALAITVIVAGVCMWVLMGPAVGDTHRGQVYFATLVGFFAGAMAAQHVVGVRHPVWYWLAPFVAGLIGVIVAGLQPGLMIPDTYAQVNSIPAWWLVRPLPIEMVSVGLLAVVWSHAADSDSVQ